MCGKTATISRPIGFKTNDPGCMPIDYYKKPNTYKRCYCSECYKEHEKEIEEKQKMLVLLKKQMMFERAMQILEKQKFNFYRNKEAIKVVEDKLNVEPDKFDSSYEMIAAIVLVGNHIYSKMQYKIDRYQVDFLIPDYHIVLEIDGDRHRHRRGYDSVRDEYIKANLGTDWEIIRIPTECLETNANKMIEAIDKVLEYRETSHINWREIK